MNENVGRRLSIPGGDRTDVVDATAQPRAGGLPGVDTDISGFAVEGASTGDVVAGSAMPSAEALTAEPEAALVLPAEPPLTTAEIESVLAPAIHAKRQTDREAAQAALNRKAKYARAVIAQGRSTSLVATYVNAQSALLAEMTAVEERVGQLRSLRSELEAIRSECISVGLTAMVPDPFDARQIRDNKLRLAFERFRAASMAASRV